MIRMDYAVVEISGKQFKVQEGVWIKVPKFSSIKEKDQNIIIDKVLFLRKEDKVFLGRPYLEKVKVEAKVIAPLLKDDKITVFKYKKATRFSRKYGHRSQYTKLMIQKILF